MKRRSDGVMDILLVAAPEVKVEISAEKMIVNSPNLWKVGTYEEIQGLDKDVSINHSLNGIIFQPVIQKRKFTFYQLFSKITVEISEKTIVGVNPFDFSGSNEKEIYKCPNGDTIGLNMLSQPAVLNNANLENFDFFKSREFIGVKRGLLRPQPLYFCSQTFRKLIISENLKGFKFEPTIIV